VIFIGVKSGSDLARGQWLMRLLFFVVQVFTCEMPHKSTPIFTLKTHEQDRTYKIPEPPHQQKPHLLGEV
jgi:hypothetical protein